MANPITFSLERPPVSGWTALANEARSLPGEWFRVDGLTWTRNAVHIRTGKLHPFLPAGSFEATTRNVDAVEKNKADVYLRYVGEPKA